MKIGISPFNYDTFTGEERVGKRIIKIMKGSFPLSSEIIKEIKEYRKSFHYGSRAIKPAKR